MLVHAATASADLIDSLENYLKSNVQVQEKIYIHTDNNSYFVGDTLWYKAYVLRSDNLKPTDLSRLLYVELLSPDGMLVERQHIVVTESGAACGQFALKDSLYSGYYELRAYTRWNLNFNVTHRDYTISDKRQFYNKQMAEDFFRDYEGLYSRVFPIYEKPEEDGNWAQHYFVPRPKQRLLAEKTGLECRFYPEGGTLVAGTAQRVAFELTDSKGQAMDLQGRLVCQSSKRRVTKTEVGEETVVKTIHNGRGIITANFNENQSYSLVFNYEGKDYKFPLQGVRELGAAIRYNPIDKTAVILANAVTPKALAITCRGKLAYFTRLQGDSISLADKALPTGINEIIVYDENAQPLASRLFFVNNHGMGGRIDVKLSTDSPAPFQKVSMEVQAKIEGNASLNSRNLEEKNTRQPRNLEDSSTLRPIFPRTVSISVRDFQNDTPTYDNGNILTDMLLSGELKGFVANPAYYFASDDAEHTLNLDLLLMVQGWRKYKRIEAARYLPETGLTYEGQVLKVPETVSPLDLSDLDRYEDKKSIADIMEEKSKDMIDEEKILDDSPLTKYTYDDHWGGNISKPVYVEAELNIGGKIVAAVAKTDNRGFFRINLPAFYDSALLHVKAYNISDSLKKCLTSDKADKDFLNDRAIPDYYVKRDMFFPIFSKPYSWYQQNLPLTHLSLTLPPERGGDSIVSFESSELTDNSLSELTDNSLSEHTGNSSNSLPALGGGLGRGVKLAPVTVQTKRRRGLRGIDYSKPAFVRDIYQLYNDVTDYGLSFGVMRFLEFPRQAATFVYGNMGHTKKFNIRAMVNRTTFYRSYTVPEEQREREYDTFMTQSALFEQLSLKRMLNVRFYTDYDLRTGEGFEFRTNTPNLTMEFEPVPDDGKRYTYRDRRYVFDGITYPEAFYHRSYEGNIPQDEKDYRRTLYWNPNAPLDASGHFSTSFYNNSRQTVLTVSAAGVSHEGMIYVSGPQTP